MINATERVNLFGWKNCIVIESGETKIVVTTDVGPRIIWAGHVDDEITLENNIFGGFPEQLGKSEETGFQFRMGDRFWLAPEEKGPKTYDPDNYPVETVHVDNRYVCIIQMTGSTGLQKSILIQGNNHSVSGDILIERRLQNRRERTFEEVALWGLSGMVLNGTAIFARRPFQYHPAFVPDGAPTEKIGGLGPVQNMTLWPYTNLQDPRLTFGQKYVFLRQDPNVIKYNVNKFGLSDVYWVAYLVQTKAGARLFVKRIYFDKDNQHNYPDRGAVFQIFVCNQFLEIEETGPVENIRFARWSSPLIDQWSVHKISQMPMTLTETWVDEHVVPLVGITCE